MSPEDIRGQKIAVPGMMTTAFLTLRLAEPVFEAVVMPFDRIMEAVKRRHVDAGLLIHEGQLTYGQEGLHKVMDMGEWWHERTGLPLPLGGNGIRRNLGRERIQKISRLICESIQYGLDHRQDALRHALTFARGLKSEETDRFVSMYVNSRTLDYGLDGRKAVQLLLDESYANRIISKPVRVEFAD